MPAVARQGDIDDSDSGGDITGSTVASVLINGMPAAVVGSLVSPHAPWGSPHPPHEAATIAAGSNTILVDGMALARVGDPLSCGHSILTGSDDVVAD
jgi:uncharacterized Zn-binding protein involved in type VI secretion